MTRSKTARPTATVRPAVTARRAAMAVTVAMEATVAAVHAEPAIPVVICGLQILVVNVWEEICAHACK